MKLNFLLIILLPIFTFALCLWNPTQRFVGEDMPINNGVEDVPCLISDDDEFFYAFGVGDPATAIRSAQSFMSHKLSCIYSVIIHDYSRQMGMGEDSFSSQHREDVGEQVIKATIDVAREMCRQISRDEYGNILMYVTISVSKKEFVNDLVQKNSEDEQLKVHFDEKTFRDSAIKIFRESNNREFNERKDSNNQ